jgi:hypothetical protein
MKAYGKEEVQFHLFPTSAPKGGEGSASLSAALRPDRYPLNTTLGGHRSRFGRFR